MNFMRRVLIAAILSMVISNVAAGCAFWRGMTTSHYVLYLEKAIGKATQSDVIQEWGVPEKTQTLDTGVVVSEYKFKRFSSVASAVICKGYTLRFDREGVLREWNNNYC